MFQVSVTGLCVVLQVQRYIFDWIKTNANTASPPNKTVCISVRLSVERKAIDAYAFV